MLNNKSRNAWYASRRQSGRSIDENTASKARGSAGSFTLLQSLRGDNISEVLINLGEMLPFSTLRPFCKR